MSQIINQSKTIAILNNIPQEFENYSDFVIIGINPYIKSTELPSHLRIMVRGNPVSILNHIIWNEIYQRTLLRQLYQKLMASGGNKDSIFIRFNGGDPKPLSKTIVWKQRFKLSKSSQSSIQAITESIYPVQIQIEGFLQDGGSKKVTIDLVNISSLNKQSSDTIFRIKQTPYNLIFEYNTDLKTKNNQPLFSKTLKSQASHKKSKSSFKNINSTTLKKSYKQNVHSKCKISKEQFFNRPQLKTKTPEKMKKIFQKYEQKAIQKQRTQLKLRKDSQSKIQMSTGRKSINVMIKEQDLRETNPNCLANNKKSHSNIISQIQPSTQRLSFYDKYQQMDNYGSKQSGRSLSINRQQMLGKIIRQKHGRLVAVEEKFMTQQQNWNKVLKQKQSFHQKQLIDIKNEVSSLLESYASKCETFKQQNQHLRAYSEKSRRDNQQLTNKLAEARVENQLKQKRIKELQEIISSKQGQWSRTIQKQKDRYLQIVKRLKMIETDQCEQKQKSRVNQRSIPLKQKQNINCY